MSPFLQRLQQVIGTALILAFFSEFYFLNEGPVQELLAGMAESPFVPLVGFLELIAYYALFSYPMLICIGYFRVSNWASLVLAAGLYGLAAEAMIVPVVYEAMPYSVFWTSLSWHTLIDVLFGWYILRWALRARAVWPAVFLMCVAGIFWGIWATWFWGETPEGALSLRSFASVSVATSLALLIGMILADHAPVTTFNASPAEVVGIALISSGFFVFTGWPYFPLPVLILAMVGIILAALRTARGQGDQDLLACLDQPPKWSRYLAVALLPIAAIATYYAVLETGFQIAAEDVVLSILSVGALSFLSALVGPFWRRLRA